MHKSLKVYMAGPLFNRNDRLIRKQDVDNLRAYAADYDVSLDIYAPIEAAFNLTQQAIATNEPNNVVIFDGDNDYLDPADIVILDIDTHDAGTMLELGRCCASHLWKKTPAKIYVLWTNQLCGDDFKNCINRYVLGMIESHATWIQSIQDAFNHIVADFGLERR